MDMLHFLYHTVPGRLLLKPLSARPMTRAAGRFLDSRYSRFLIEPFIRKNGIRLADYQPEEYACFNDCFSRRIRPELRPVDAEPAHAVAPCDGLLTVWPIRDGLVLPVKQSLYSIERLLKDRELAARYRDGYCLVFRLCVDHYHRYAYAETGEKSADVEIPGVFHTVRPVALESRPVFTENSRTYTVIRTERAGALVQMEVGAMLVGRIANHEKRESKVIRGEEKGTFLYGGSTVIVLVEAGRFRPDAAIRNASMLGQETPVRLGQKIGEILGEKGKE